jgi:hypothetical protein
MKSAPELAPQAHLRPGSLYGSRLTPGDARARRGRWRGRRRQGSARVCLRTPSIDDRKRRLGRIDPCTRVVTSPRGKRRSGTFPDEIGNRGPGRLCSGLTRLPPATAGDHCASLFHATIAIDCSARLGGRWGRALRERRRSADRGAAGSISADHRRHGQALECGARVDSAASRCIDLLDQRAGDPAPAWRTEHASQSGAAAGPWRRAGLVQPAEASTTACSSV